LGGGQIAAQAQGIGIFTHGLNAKGDVFFERDAEFRGSVADIIAIYTFGESFVFKFFGDGRSFKIEDAFGWTDIDAGGEESGEFIASEKRVLERGFARDSAIVGVSDDGADDFFGVAAFTQEFGAFGGMFLVGSVIVVGPAFVIEIMEERGQAPSLFVGAVFASVGPDAGFHRQHVLAQRFGLRIFTNQLPSIVSGRHEILTAMRQLLEHSNMQNRSFDANFAIPFWRDNQSQ
jgi:hypothetical protein